MIRELGEHEFLAKRLSEMPESQESDAMREEDIDKLVACLNALPDDMARKNRLSELVQLHEELEFMGDGEGSVERDNLVSTRLEAERKDPNSFLYKLEKLKEKYQG